MIAGPRITERSTTAPGSMTTLPSMRLSASTVPSMRRSNVSRISRFASSMSSSLPVSFHQPVDDVRAHGQAAVDQVLNGVGDFQLVAEARLDPVDRLEHLRAEHVDADEREVADRLLRLLDQPHDLAVAQLGDAEHLRIGHARQQNLRRRPLALELSHEVGDALVEQVVAQVHDERLVRR